MTLLVVMPDDDPADVVLRSRDAGLIRTELAALGIGFDRWPVRGAVTPTSTADEVLALYRGEVDALSARSGMKVVDVAQLLPEPGAAWAERAAAARTTFLAEHRHAEDEVRFFAHGRGCFYLHVGERVHAVVCEAGDLLSVPAGTRHWFDMGRAPEFCAVRFFQEADGWVGDFTGDPLAAAFPDLDALLAGER
ncbi:1,2-dihydroxy-3-keto-5-methylthiopentene dioxygenase [Streptomyces sp. NPDC093225]|uniref:1,2-dihydroxy-3-keto-5-methylthiopentene dioxygenase n=1 Tax=Streptomyces sp. NPDC093225 TaxID=3366034 RepID=UPI0037FD135F